jgi:hypothetical protein
MVRWCAASTIPVAAFPVAALLALYPIFFVLFRLSVFSTVPTDDYAPYLLWLLGEPGGGFPLSPYCYRILSMAAAAPFYYMLPPLDLTNIPKSLPPSWIRATAALSALAYVSMVGSMLTMATLAVRKCGLSLRDGVLAGFLLLLLTFYTQVTAIDPLAVLVVALAIFLVDRTWVFAAVILVSVGINEKIALVLASWLSVRWLFIAEDRAHLTLPWLCSLAAVGLYLSIVLLLRLPGHEYQLNPHGFLGTAVDNLRAYFSARGILLNALPALVLATIGGLGHAACSSIGTRPMFRAIDLLTIPAMLAVALIFTQQFQGGRLAMHAAPLFVLPFIASLPASGYPARAIKATRTT